MLLFNGLAFAKNNAEFTGTLFRPVNGRTAHGFYSKRRNGYLLRDAQGNARAFIVNNSHGERFIVTAHDTDKGVRFMFSTCADTEQWLGLDRLSYSEECAAARAAAEQ